MSLIVMTPVGLRTFISLLVLVIFRSTSFGQNLVPNPSFEDYKACPVKLGNAAQDLQGWSMPTLGSTDFFHQCSATMGVPDNFNGSQSPKDGLGYVGFYAYAPNDYREYLQVRLISPLIKDSTYTLTYYLSLSERSDYAVAGIDVLFTFKMLSVKSKKPLTKKNWIGPGRAKYHYLEDTRSNFYENTENWQKVSTTFTANGSERYLILGNFKSNQQTRVINTGISSNKGAYYYLDAISIKPDFDQVPLQAFTVDTLLVLPSVLFDFDTSRLTPTGLAEVQKIADFMEADYRLEIEIHGHTDSYGSEGYNDRLSQERCLTVVEFLKEKGIAQDRISWQGFGASVPVADNHSAKGRQQNRRVEFRFRYPDSQ